MRELLGPLHGQGHQEPCCGHTSPATGAPVLCTVLGMAETIGRTLETCSPTTLPFSELEEGRLEHQDYQHPGVLTTFLIPSVPKTTRAGLPPFFFLPPRMPQGLHPQTHLLPHQKNWESPFSMQRVTAVCSAVGNSNKNLADVQNSAACSSKISPPCFQCWITTVGGAPWATKLSAWGNGSETIPKSYVSCIHSFNNIYGGPTMCQALTHSLK